MTDNVLIGKLVSWPNTGDETSSNFVGCGRGKVVAMIDSRFMLIRRIARSGDTEPAYMLVLPFDLPNIHFFNSIDQEKKWFAWVVSSPEPIVRLVGKE